MDKIDYEARKTFYDSNDIKNVNLKKLFNIVKKAVITNNPKLLSYEKFISIGTKKEEAIDEDQLKKFLFKVYKIWWNKWLLPCVKGNEKNMYSLEKYIKFAGDPNNVPNNFDYQRIIDVIYKMENLYYTPFKFQNYSFKKLFCRIDANLLSLDRIDLYDQWCQVRLYLTTDIENTIPLSEKLLKEALDNNVPLNMKISLVSNRNDSFVLYTNFRYVQQLVDMIENVRTENPNLFKEIKNPLLARYNSYVGIGEEPFIFGSYTSQRVELLEKMYLDLSNQYKEDKNCLSLENIFACYEKNCDYLQINKDDLYKNDEKDLEKRVRFYR